MRADMSPEEPLSYQGIYSYWKDFTAGCNRDRGTIPKDYISSVTRVRTSSVVFLRTRRLLLPAP